jgi:cytochrome b6-f complex iron-sulfur subunit
MIDPSHEETETQAPHRRAFLKWLTRIFLSLWGVGVIGVITSFIRAPSMPRSAGLNILRAGDADSLARGEARLVRHGSSPLHVVRLPSEEIVAVSALCTHFSCVLNWDPQARTFVCPCHDGVFSATGDVISGLPTRALDTFRVEIRRGEILVHE